MFRVALAFCGGVIAVHALPALWPAALLVLPVVTALLVARRRPVLAGAIAGFAWAQLLATWLLAPAWSCTRDREETRLTGRVSAPAFERMERTDFDIDVLRASSAGPWPRRVRLSWYEAEAQPRPGETWRLDVRLRCRRGFANPGTQDRELALLRERIDATGYVVGKSRPERLARPENLPIERLRERIAGSIADALPPGPSVSVLQGLTVGIRGSIPNSLWEAFAVTGIAHLMAISGLHVTGCAVSVLAFLRLAWRLPALVRLRMRLALESIAVVTVTAAYALLSGGSLPALRTLAMVAIFATLRWLRRTVPLHQSLGLAALALVACDPLALVTPGFWLSFVATAALFAILMRDTGWRGQLIAFARAQIAITALLAPVLAVTFGRISLISPMANAVAVPIFSFVLLPAVLAGTVIAAIEPEATMHLWRWLAWLLDGAWPWLESIAAWPGASWAPAAQPMALIGAACALLFAALLLPVAGLRCAAGTVLLAITLGRSDSPSQGSFILTAIDVGQGLAVVVETAGHVLVFDTGARWRGGSSAAQVSLLPYLRARGIRKIDRLVVSHDDDDHAGGADVIRDVFVVSQTMTSPGSLIASDETCQRGNGWNWDGIAFLVLHPPPAFEGGDNDRSCAIVVTGPGGTALLLADPEAAAEAELLGQPLSADVVLLPHHGSRSSSSAGLVAAVAPRIGIASTGFGNRWGMPDSDVVARWRAAGTSVLNTAEEGAVRASFPPRAGSVEIRTERRDRRRWWRAGAGD